MKRSTHEDAINPFWSSISIPDLGYQWIETAEPSHGRIFGQESTHGAPPYLIVHPRAAVETRQNPIEDTTLQAVFGELNPTREAILKFANAYGWLGIGEYFHHGQGSNIFRAEGLNLWTGEIQDMALARWIFTRLASYDLATMESKDDSRLGKDREDLRRIFVWTQNFVRVNVGIVGTSIRPGLSSLDGVKPPARCLNELLAATEDALRPDLFRAWTTDGNRNPIQAAQFYLLKIVNKKLTGNASPHLFVDRGRFEGKVIPHNLLSLIWLQFYREISGQTKMRQCSVCRKWMDVTDCRSTKRMHEQCSKAERMKRWKPTKEARPESTRGRPVRR